MFTGLIKEVGQIKKLQKNSEGYLLEISCPHLINEIKVDDSVAVNGVCLTATKIFETSFQCQCIHVTLEKTSLKHLSLNSPVNLELALRFSDRLGGHLVQGHVNGLGKIIKMTNRGENFEMWINYPQKFSPYFIPEGSIALDGISLTIAKLEDTQLCVSLIPHTWNHTNLKNKKIGDSINIEVDMMAKYIEKMLSYSQLANASNSLSPQWLAEKGF